MRGSPIFFFVFVMWVLIILGGFIVVTILGPITISGYGDLDFIIASGIKAVIAIILVVFWIFLLSKLKNWIFHKKIQD